LGFLQINVPERADYSVPALWRRVELDMRIREIQRRVAESAPGVGNPVAMAASLWWQETVQTTARSLHRARGDRHEYATILVAAFLHDMIGANGNRRLLPDEWRGDVARLLRQARQSLDRRLWHHASANALPGSGTVQALSEFTSPVTLRHIGELARVAVESTFAEHQLVHLVGQEEAHNE